MSNPKVNKPKTFADKVKDYKNNTIDITKTGPLSYKQLQQLNSGLKEPSKEYLMSDPDIAGTMSLMKPTFRKNALPQGTDIGESTYDKGIYTPSELEQYQDVRAEQQPWYSKATSGILKGVGLAGTTIVDGTVGLANGIVESIVEGDPTKIWDNTTTQFMDALNKDMEKALPNYYTRDERENPWGNIISANFIFDKFVKNLGFTVGAAFSGGIYTKALTGAMKGIGGLMGATKALRGVKMAEGIGTMDRMKKYAEIGARAFDMKNPVRATKAVVGSTFGAIAEGTVEAVSNSNDQVRLATLELEDKVKRDKVQALDDFYNDIDSGMSEEDATYIYNSKVAQIDKAAQETKNKIEENRQKMGSAILLANIPILTFDNYFTFGKMFAGGFKAGRSRINTVTKATNEAKRQAKEAWKSGNKEVQKNLDRIISKAKREGYGSLTTAEKALIEEAPKQILGPKMGAIYSGLKAPMREGNEEMMQALASEVSGDYYKKESDYIYDSKIHPETTQQLANDVDRFWDSLKTGISNTYGNANRWEEFFIGALTGAIGAPTFGRKNNSTDQTWLGKGKVVGISGGLKTEYRDYKRKRKEKEKIANEVTRVLKDDKILDRIKHTVSQMKIDNDKETALRLNDKKLFKDAETAALFEDIMYLKRAGKLDYLDSIISSIDNATDEEVKEIADSVHKLVSANDNNINDKRKKFQDAADKLNKAINQTTSISKQIDEAINSGESQDVIDVLQSQYDQALTAQQQLEKKVETLSSYLDQSDVKEWSPYIHEDGTEFTTDEIRESLSKRSNKAKALIKEISEVQDQLDTATSEALTDEQLATMTYLEIAKRDWAKRGGEIVDTLKKELRDSGVFGTLANNIAENLEQLEKFTEGNVPKKVKEEATNAIKNLTTLKENLNNLLTNPEYLIPYLAHSLESEVTDKDGKKSKVDNKDAILSALKAAIESNPMYGEDTKKLRLQDIEDLGKIVDSYREYDKKLTEFMTTPSKVEQQHRKADNKAKNKSIKSLFSNIKKEINFKKPSSIKAVYNKYKQAVQDAGGWNAFLATLSEEERKAVTSAVGEDDIKDAVKKAVASDDQADDRVKKAAQQVLDGIPEYSKEAIIALSKDSSPLDPAITKAAEKAVEDEGINDAVAKAAAIATKEEEIKKSINKAVQLAANAISESNDAENDKLQKSIKNLAENPSEDGTPNITAEMANTNDGTPNISPDGLADDSSEDSFYKESHNRSQNYVEQERKKQSFVPQSRKRGYERRRQFTEYYLFGKDGQTLYDYYFNNPNKIPKGVNKERFLEYIKTVSEFLRQTNAFTYISGINPNYKLNKGDKIIFSVEPSISTQDNPVVVMKTENGQVVGTIRSQFEFAIYDAEVAADKSNINKSIEAQRELYKRVVELYRSGSKEQISTTVESLESGSLPLASKNSSVAKVFENKTPIIGLVTGDQSNLKIDVGNRNVSIAMPDNFTLARGQVYVLIPTNTGTYFPAMCFSIPIYQLADNDWYMNQTLDTFMNMLQSTSNILKLKEDFVKWFPIKNFHMDLLKIVNGKYVPVETRDTATHVSVKFDDIDGKTTKFTYSLVDKNGQRLSEDDLKRKFREFIRKTAKFNNLQTNLDKRRLNDQEYIRNIANYFMVDLMTGIRGQHSMNDGFLYAPTQIEQEYEEKGKVGPTVIKTPQDKDNVTTSVSYRGEQYTIDMASVVRNSKGEVVKGPIRDDILKSLTEPKDKKDSNKKSETKDESENTQSDIKKSQDETKDTTKPKEPQDNTGETASTKKQPLSTNLRGGRSSRTNATSATRITNIGGKKVAKDVSDSKTEQKSQPTSQSGVKYESINDFFAAVGENLFQGSKYENLTEEGRKILASLEITKEDYNQIYLHKYDTVVFIYIMDIINNHPQSDLKRRQIKVLIAEAKGELKWENLSESVKKGLAAQGTTKEKYEEFSPIDQYNLIKCARL